MSPYLPGHEPLPADVRDAEYARIAALMAHPTALADERLYGATWDANTELFPFGHKDRDLLHAHFRAQRNVERMALEVTR